MHLSFAIVKPHKICTLTIFAQYVCYKTVGYSTTRRLPTRGLDDSRTGHLADWSTHGLDKSRTGQLADATGDFACLVFVLLAASRDCELSSPRDVQSASWLSASWCIGELSSYQTV